MISRRLTIEIYGKLEGQELEVGRHKEDEKKKRKERKVLEGNEENEVCR